MKNIKILLIITLLTLFTFCNKNKEQVQEDEDIAIEQEAFPVSGSMTIDGIKYKFNEVSALKGVDHGITINVSNADAGFMINLDNIEENTSMNFSDFSPSETNINLINNFSAHLTSNSKGFMTYYTPECETNTVSCIGKLNITSFVKGTSKLFPDKVEGNFSGKLATYVNQTSKCGSPTTPKLVDAFGNFSFVAPN